MFEKFHEVIMGWKHVDNLQMGPPSTNERVGNVVNIGSNKKVIKFSVDTERKDTERRMIYVDIIRG